jgi:ABC-type transport system involved in multi-copper enzyme maturation permease subunit
MGSYGRYPKRLEALREYLEEIVILTLVWHEVKLGFKHILMMVWVVFALFFGFLFLLSTANLESLDNTLGFFGFLGTIIAVVLASSTISGEIGGVADSVLSKAIKRWEYLLSKFISQIALMLIVYFLMVGISVLLLWNFDRFPDDLSYRNLFVAIGLVGLVLAFFSSIGVMFSSMVTRSVFSFLMSIVVWFIMIFMFIIAPWDWMYSPTEILANFYNILDSSWDIDFWKLGAFYIGSPIVFFAVSMFLFYQRDL